MPDVFISYQRAEKEKVELIRSALSDLGLDVFIDTEHIESGDDWPAALENALEASKVVLGCWSKMSVASKWVRTECLYARERDKLVAVAIDGLTPRDLPFFFFNVSIEDLSELPALTASEGWRRTLRKLSRVLERPELVLGLGDDDDVPATAKSSSSSLTMEDWWRIVRDRRDLEELRAYVKHAQGGRYEAAANALIRDLELQEDHAALTKQEEKLRAAREKFEREQEALKRERYWWGSESVWRGSYLSGDPAPFTQFSDLEWSPTMVVMPPGAFLMGSPLDEAGRDESEMVQSLQLVSKRFAVSKFPILVREWSRAASDLRVSKVGTHSDRPAVLVSWQKACAYASWLTRKTGRGYRLLTNAEWEYCCRAGSSRPYCTGDSISRDQACFIENPSVEEPSAEPRPGDLTAPESPTKYPPNAFGLHCMHGNVWEWVADGPETGGRYMCGGCFSSPLTQIRASSRLVKDPWQYFTNVGFRVACDL